jgi:hypothetical protein
VVLERPDCKRQGEENSHKIKRRPELFSSGRLGSPPPELPNHDTHTRLGAPECKCHFRNRREQGSNPEASARRNYDQ